MVSIRIEIPGGQRKTVNVDEDTIQVSDLKDYLCKKIPVASGNCELIRPPTILKEDDAILKLSHNERIVVVPLPPKRTTSLASQPSTSRDVGGWAVTRQRTHPQHAQHEDEDEDDDVTIPLHGAPLFYRNFLLYLQNEWKVPDYVIGLFACVKWWFWPSLVLWFCLIPVFHKYSLGPVYVLFSIIAVIFCNLGSRKPGEASPYTIFNDFQPLAGQLDADDLDRQIRGGVRM